MTVHISNEVPAIEHLSFAVLRGKSVTTWEEKPKHCCSADRAVDQPPVEGEDAGYSSDGSTQLGVGDSTMYPRPWLKLLHMHTRTCMCGELCDLLAALVRI